MKRGMHPGYRPVVLADPLADMAFLTRSTRTSVQRIGWARGCFWLPSRPGEVCGWEGAGGQLSIGTVGSWGRSAPLTRITVTGLDDGADAVRGAFEGCLLTEAKTAARGTAWEMSHDGFEPWLGPINRAA